MVNLDKPGHVNTLSNLIEKDLPDDYYIAINAPHSVTLEYLGSTLSASPDVSWLNELDYKITTTLLTIIALFDYLSENRFAFLFGDTKIDGLGKHIINAKYETFNFLDDDIKELLHKYARKKIHVSETLKFLAMHEFKDDEQLNFEATIQVSKDSLKTAQNAVVVAQDSLSITRNGVKVATFALIVSTIAFVASILTFSIQFSTTPEVKINNPVIQVSLREAQAKLLQQTADDVAAMKSVLKERVKPEPQKPQKPKGR